MSVKPFGLLGDIKTTNVTIESYKEEMTYLCTFFHGVAVYGATALFSA